MPAAMTALALALMISSVSAWYSRRSEWPTTTYRQPSLASMSAEISPVYAPEAWTETSCAPHAIGYFSPSISVCTVRMSVNGTMTAASVVAGLYLWSDSVHASFWTSPVASTWLRFIFQLPAISGVRFAIAQPSSTDRPGRAVSYTHLTLPTKR